jgi:hypothetical protein
VFGIMIYSMNLPIMFGLPYQFTRLLEEPE